MSPKQSIGAMGGAASMLKKPERDDDAEGANEHGDDEGLENVNTNAQPSKIMTAVGNLKKKTSKFANKALARVGLVIEEEDSPDEEEDTTPQKKKAPLPNRTGSEVSMLTRVSSPCVLFCFEP